MKYLEARDVIYTVLSTVWDPQYVINWPDVPEEVPDVELAWARATIKTDGGRQIGLSDQVGRRRFNTNGVFILQIFSPIGDGLTLGYELAQTVVDAYCGTHNDNLWFRNIRMKEVPGSGEFTQINVSVDFNYDDLR